MPDTLWTFFLQLKKHLIAINPVSHHTLSILSASSPTELSTNRSLARRPNKVTNSVCTPRPCRHANRHLVACRGQVWPRRGSGAPSSFLRPSFCPAFVLPSSFLRPSFVLPSSFLRPPLSPLSPLSLLSPSSPLPPLSSSAPLASLASLSSLFVVAVDYNKRGRAR